MPDRKVTLLLPEELWRALREYMVRNDLPNLTAVVVKVLREFIEQVKR